MIPIFPEFKNIDIEDKRYIDSYTRNFKPYSDFNFTNLWSWDTKQKRRISLLHGNLVVVFTDYQTRAPLISYLGFRKPIKTAKALIAYAHKANISTTLHFITEKTAKRLKSKTLEVEADESNFDYIFSTSQLADSLGSKLKKKRQQAKRFIRENPDAIFKVQKLTDPKVHKHLIATLKRWEHSKKLQSKESNFEHERAAIKRLLTTSQIHNVLVSSIYCKDKMLAFSIDELLSHQYAISHFLKADITYKGIYEFLNKETAQYLKNQGVKLWNWEQDLNIEGLRKLKKSYQPVHFLKKYKVFESYRK